MQNQELLPHLFRTEFSKITAVLCKHFGIEHIEIAEDIAGDTFLSAFEIWSYKGIPANPTAWLYSVAKNKAKNYLHRDALFKKKVAVELKNDWQENSQTEINLSAQNINDSLLQMLFAICHPAIPAESQIALSLRILCGFGIDEISTALLSNKETINKRLFRAKEKLTLEKVKIVFPTEKEIDKRLETVLITLYLLYNEGYYSESQETLVREDLCLEAMRLTNLLLENKHTNKSSVNALFALMCFQSSRFGARKDKNGGMILYQDQDETLWNKALIAKGAYYLHLASNGNTISKYHLEASIAYWYTIKEDTTEKWETILQLFNKLLQVEYAPIIALNRTFALSKVKGKATAIIEAEKLKLTDNHFYYALLGELHKGVDNGAAKQNFKMALTLARTTTDKQTIQKQIDQL